MGINRDPYEDEESGRTGSGGQGGEIIFRYHDAMSDQPRDDNLPEAKKKELLGTHKERSKSHIDNARKQKEIRKLLKEGKVAQANFNQGLGYGASNQGGNNQFKTHFLSNTVEHGAGMRDNQVSLNTAENTADTNPEMQAELQNELRHTLQLTPGKKMAPPRPSPFS